MSRTLPAITDVNRGYWTGGQSGQLRIERCRACRRYQHPPEGACATCGDGVELVEVSGRGSVFTFTINSQAFHPDVPTPYVIALVELEEQAGLTVPTNIVGIDPTDVAIGMPVRVRFEENGDAWVPLFEPDGDR